MSSRRVFYPIANREDYRKLTPERIKEIRTQRGETQAQMALAITEVIHRWTGIGTVPVQAQSVQHYEVGRQKPGPLNGVAILVLSERQEE